MYFLFFAFWFLEVIVFIFFFEVKLIYREAWRAVIHRAARSWT